MADYEWHLEDEVWLESDTGFVLKGVAGKDIPDGWSAEALALQLGARRRACNNENADKTIGASTTRLYPWAFRYCPEDGVPLPDDEMSESKHWLPPFGNTPNQRKPMGLRLTDLDLRPAKKVDTLSKPDREMKLPRGGCYQFMVGQLGTRRSALVAVDVGAGTLYVWTGATESGWAELRATKGQQRLGACRRTLGAWGMVSCDGLVSGLVWLLTDHGLCELRLDIAGLAYSARYVGSEHCLGAPLEFDGRIATPSLGEDGRLLVQIVGRLDEIQEESVDGFEASDTPHLFLNAIRNSAALIWESSQGQIHVFTHPRTGKLVVEFIHWPTGYQPKFELGAPYCDANMNLWRQCFVEGGKEASDGTRKHWWYVQLGRNSPETVDSDGPRLSTGGLSFRAGGGVILEHQKPWEDDGLGGAGNIQQRLTVPIVEHDNSDVVFCAELDESGDVLRTLNAAQSQSGRYCLRGKTSLEFFNFNLRRPWEVRLFVWDGHLFLYHEDLQTISGWKLAQ